MGIVRVRGHVLAGLIAIAGAAPIGSHAQDETAKPETGVEYWKEAAARYRIASGTDSAGPLTFRAEPILRWTNPLRRTGDGAVFLWTDRGRPEVVASFYNYKRGETLIEDHEFMSMATGPLVAGLAGRAVWMPAVGGVTPRPIPGAPKPGAGPAERLRQMRALAREFKASLNNENDKSELRLLPQPLYRFEVDKARTDVLDGALFAFVQTTDPEVLLQIEARTPSGGGPASWHYSIARMSLVGLRAYHKDAEVWSADWDYDVENPTKPYITRRDITRRG